MQSMTIQTDRSIKRADTLFALESVFAEYHPELLEEYGVFAKEGKDEEKIGRRLWFYGAKNMEHQIHRIQLLTDNEGNAYVTSYEAWSDTRQNLPVLTRENYEFLGWSATKDGSTGLIKPKETTAQNISPSFADESQKIILYPQWRKLVASISVAQLPEKCRYKQGEDLDWTGLRILVHYADGSEELLEEGFLLTAKNLQKEEVVVLYQGQTVSFQISLSPKPMELTYIFMVAGGLLLVAAVVVLVIVRKRKRVSV